ncbi:LutB/LldF family L-lactate oxidation iron-sulfur protein [Kocuria sp.]|uniref:LutB/LldF family L-lactate oxidation iron-sulfur protein n=1 Tax=Kocuria sp. TaxID=1871328 RepID=UPI0026DFB92E|nr:LutB/LldF family L-lactate oxidation iron-sulfur protein [Kocuria sp.]MDO5618930.1 LutB/LldF family L-lactate oxidation iron-sulfur protein [Kocuria sp.]
MTTVDLGMPGTRVAYGSGNLYEETPFPEHAREELKNAQMRANIGHATHTIRGKRARVVGELPDWQDLRDAGSAIKQEVAAHLPELLEQFETNVRARGGVVHWARDAAEANRIVTELVQAKGAQEIIKVKSMATQEIGLNEHLEAQGITAHETDLAELIVQLGDDKPSHILVPAIHKNRDEIREIFSRRMPGTGKELTNEPAVLAEAARTYLREKFLETTVAVSGANFGIAETGTLTVVESEGNGRMCLTLPKTLITVMGIEKLLPRFADLEVFTQLLPRSSTGERMNPYTSMWTGVAEGDGPEEFHLVLLDNGRSAVLGDPVGRSALHCIRCSACLNVCPVYEHAGGHAYGSTYPGPIGAILSPQLTGVAAEQNNSLPYASSLCGRCYEVCPVKIDIPSILVHLRDEDVRTKHGQRDAAATQQRATVIEAREAEAQAAGTPPEPSEHPATAPKKRVPSEMDLLMKAAGTVMSSGTRMGLAERALPLGRGALKPFGGAKWLPGTVGGWTQERDIPVPPNQSFRNWWRKHGEDSEQRVAQDLGGAQLAPSAGGEVAASSLAAAIHEHAAWGAEAQAVAKLRAERSSAEGATTKDSPTTSTGEHHGGQQA